METRLTAETIEEFLDYCVSRGRQENTIRAYRSDLNAFLTDVSQDLKLQDLLQKDKLETAAAAYLNTWRTKLAPKTTGRRLTTLRCFLKFLGVQNPLAEYTPPTPSRSLPHPLPAGVADLQAMVGCCKNDRQRALVGLTGFMGLRLGEAISIRVTDFDLNEMTLKVRGKGDKTRIVPISDSAWELCQHAVLDALMSKSPTVIEYKDRFARQIITTLGKKAGVSRTVSSHDMRATFATAAYAHTTDIRAVQELLGHASSSTTEIYTGVSMQSMRTAACI